VSFSFLLPDIGEGLEEAEVVEWLVAVGDEVVRDQPLVEVLTDKASSELPSPVAGTIVRFGAAEGERLRVGALLIEIDDGSRPTGASDAAATAPTHSSFSADPLEAPDLAPPASPQGRRPKASPATRRLALDLGVDLAAVIGSGPGERITAADVHAVASTPETSSEPAHLFEPTPLPAAEVMARPDLGQAMPGRHDLRGVRGVVARNMAQAWSEIPHIHSMDEIDASLLVDFRTRIRSMDRLGADAVTLLAVAAMASVRALIRYPVANAHVEGHPGDAMVVPDGVHLGIATATERGLVVPVVHDAHHLDLFAMAVRIVEATGRARTGEATTADLTGATFTITNYGSLGGRFATPIIPPGQGAILGLGAVAERPVVVDGAVVARPTLPVVLGADHRIIDGDLAEAFRRSVVEDLTEPLNLLVGG